MFFFFESEQERRVREDVEKNLETCIQNPSKYNSAKQVLTMHVSSSNQKAIEQIVDCIKATIKNQDLQPVRKYQAILLLKDLMLTHNKALGKYVVKKTLKRLTILAQHKNGTKEEADEKRGRDIFGSVNGDQQKYSINFLNTLLMALEEWGKKWPKNPDGPYNDFNRQYNQLVMNKVQFPIKKVQEMQPNSKKSISLSPGASDKKIKERQKSKPKVSTEIKPKMKPSLQKQVNEFLEKMKDSINFFAECLGSTTLEDFSFLRDIYSEMEKAGEKGNDLIIKLEGGLENTHQAKKILQLFGFLQDLKKQLNVVSKKPDKLQSFKKTYVQKANNLIKYLNEKQKEKGSQLREQSSSISKEKSSTSEIKTESITPREPKRDIPKIKAPNRYSSVSGGPVLAQFQHAQPQPSELKVESIHSEKFGSFGGPNTERHRAPGAVVSPSEDKIKDEKNYAEKNAESVPRSKGRESRDSEVQSEVKESKVENKKPEKSDELIVQKTVEKIKKIEPQKKIDQKPQPIEKPEENLSKSGDFFKQFPVQTEKNHSKPPENPFIANDSFGAFGSQKGASKDLSQQQDFFSKLEKDNKVGTNNINNIQPRRKPHKSAEEKDFFDNNIKSQISDGLSAFDSKKQGDNSQISGIKSDKRNAPQFDSKKSVVFDHPFGAEEPPEPPTVKSQVSQANKSVNFFEEFDNRPGMQKIASNNVIRESVVIEFDVGSVKADNPFATGNFGNMIHKDKEEEDKKSNPFETESYQSKKVLQKSISNPFQENSFERQNRSHTSINSKGSKENPFASQQKNPFATEKKEPSMLQQSNPFGTERGSVENPFQTSTHNSKRNKQEIDEILDIFKPPTEKVIDDLSQRGSFKLINGPVTTSPHQPSQNPRESIVFTVNLEKEDNSGLNFSQFQDVKISQKNISTPPPVVNPYDQKGENQHQQSGFSISNFAPIGGDPFAVRNSDLGNTHDFFAKFQSKSQESKHSKKQITERERQSGENNKNTRDLFGQFNAKNSLSNRDSSVKKEGNVVQHEKTVRSSQQKSFDFDQLDRISGIQRAGNKKAGQTKQVKFEDFGVWGQSQSTSRKDVKEGVLIDNNSQRSLNWQEFDIKGSHQHTVKNLQHSDHFKQTDEFRSNILQMESKNNFYGVKQRAGTDRLPASNSNIDKDQSIQIILEDFAPISKKGIQWNPLNKIPNLKPSPYTYLIDQNKLKETKNELMKVKNEYNLKVQAFKEMKEKNDQIRGKFMQKMKKSDEVMTQKLEYQQILSKIKEANEIKEKHISEINYKIKAAQQIKAKILQKEKLLYEITKNQINLQERKAPVQRSMVSKWQMFNRNLEKNRNTAVYTSRFSQGY